MSTKKPARGRPPVPGTLAPSDRTDLWRRSLRQAKGKVLQVNLGPTAWALLQAMAQRGKRGPLIEDLILAEARRRKIPLE